MSAGYFNNLQQKYAKKATFHPIGVPPPAAPVSPPVPPIPPKPVVVPESVRVSKKRCSTCVVNSVFEPMPPILIPVDIVPTSSSTTVQTARDATLYESRNPMNPATRFTEFFPPSVPPPQFLQVPRTRVGGEPKARIYPCINGFHNWTSLY